MEKRQLWGFIDKSGNFIIEPQFDGAGDFQDGLALVKIDWRRGYIDKAGAYAIEPQFQLANSFSEGLACVMLDDKWGYIGKDGSFVIPLQYDKAMDFHDGIAQVEIGNEWFYIDKSGNRVPDPNSTQEPFSEQAEWPMRKVEGDKIGYVNESGEFVIKPAYFDAGPFCDGLARVKKGRTSQWGFIDRDGKPAFKEKFEAAGDFHEEVAKVLVKI